MAGYYQLLQRQQLAIDHQYARYCATDLAQGAWNEHEQHMAPATGIICAELDYFMPRADMRIGRISLDILGLIPKGEFEIVTKVIRPGKTIELIESIFTAQGKTCIVARTWRMLVNDTQAVHGIEDQAVAGPEQAAVWHEIQNWPGGYIRSIEARTTERRPGKGVVWLNSYADMVEGEATSDFVRLMGMIDTANGIVTRQNWPFQYSFPNLDLQIHLYRMPVGAWLGLEAVQQYGSDGIGLTSAVLHDQKGPFGRSEQILTLRKMTE